MSKTAKVSKEMRELLKRIAAQNEASRTKRKEAAVPKVGVFFVRRGDLWIDSTPAHEAVAYGDMMIHDKGHDAFWGELQARGAVSKDEEYDEVPRGRVCYNTRSRIYHLYLDRCILRNKEMVRKIIRSMTLPSAPLTEISTDSHYKCPACLHQPEEEL